MARRNTGASTPGERIPIWQRLLDDVFLLLALGLALPLLFYILWGVWDLARLPSVTP